MKTYAIEEQESRHLSDVIINAIGVFNVHTDMGTIAAGLKVAADLRWDSGLAALRLIDRDESTFITGLPLAPLGVKKWHEVLAAAVTALAKLGFNWNWEAQGGRVFQTIEPSTNGAENSNATAGAFGFHSDDAATGEYAPQFIVLVGSNNVAAARTGWVSAKSLVESMPRAFLVAAMSARFLIRVPASLAGGVERWVGPVPLISLDSNGIYKIAAPTYGVKPLDKASLIDLATIEFLKNVSAEKAEWVTLKPGCALVIANWHGLHGREPIVGDRSAVRVYANTTLRRHVDELGQHDSFVFAEGTALLPFAPRAQALTLQEVA